MSNRSGFVSIALLLLPTIILVAFRTLAPEFNDALSNDTSDQIIVHSTGIILGIFLVYRYSRVFDHEYQRSKTIESLSKIYKLEDKGLWEKGEVAIQRLEARAFSEFKGRKASKSRQRMQGKIGQLNRESVESEEIDEEYSEDTMSIVGSNPDPLQKGNKKKITDIISTFVSNSIDSAAIRRKQKSEKDESRKRDKSTFSVKERDSRWIIPDGIQRKARLCSSCSTYNDPESNYCTTCGSIMN